MPKYQFKANTLYIHIDDPDIPVTGFMIEVVDSHTLLCAYGDFTRHGFAYAIGGRFWVDGYHELIDTAGKVSEFRLVALMSRLPVYVPVYAPAPTPTYQLEGAYQ